MWMEIEPHGVLKLAVPLLRHSLRSRFEREHEEHQGDLGERRAIAPKSLIAEVRHYWPLGTA